MVRTPKKSCYRTIDGTLKKRCPSCKRWKAHTTDYFGGTGKPGLLHSSCRICRVAANARSRLLAKLRIGHPPCLLAEVWR